MEWLPQTAQPPKRWIRSATTLEVYYGFGDASAVRFILDIEVKDELVFRHGHWCDAMAEASSNYRELKNLVDGLEEMVRLGRVKDAEVFLVTDNTTAEAVFYRGNSTTRPLFELMLRLRKVEMDGGLNLRVIHVAGSRMIEQGTDGGSRGDLTQGVMAGEPMLKYVPLHLTALERSPQLEPWIRSWWDDDQGELLTSFVGNCAECGKVCQDGKGLFCANFSVARGYYSPFRKAWCGKCYRIPAGLAFPIRTPKDEEGFGHVVKVSSMPQTEQTGSARSNATCAISDTSRTATLNP
jgi:hypothetical protein